MSPFFIPVIMVYYTEEVHYEKVQREKNRF